MKKKRSPAHPAIGLRQAIELARKIHGSFNEHWASIDALADDWKVSVKGSGFLQNLSALKQFGLVDEKGSREKREFKLTDIALDIVLHEDGSTERAEAIKQAALSPAIHRELWDKYDGVIPDSDSALRSYLVRQREDGTFNNTYVDEFIQQFRETLTFSGVSSGDTISREEAAGTGRSQDGSRKPETPADLFGFGNNFFNAYAKPKMIATKEQPTAPEQKREMFTLAEGDVMVQWPAELSESSYQDFEDHLNLILRKVKRSLTHGEE